MSERTDLDKSPRKLNPLVLILIVGLAISFEVYTFTGHFDEEQFNIADSFFFIGPVVCMIMSFVVAKHYKKESPYRPAYLALGIGIFFFFLGDFTYIAIYDLLLDEDPYPSIADLFYWLFYPFAIYHILRNVRYFRPSIKRREIGMMFAISVMLISVYATMSLQELEEPSFDFWYGLIFVCSAVVTLSFSLLGITSFRFSILGIIWLPLVAGLALNTIADIWYYHLEIFGLYIPLHTVDTLWLSAWMLIFYALYKHKINL